MRVSFARLTAVTVLFLCCAGLALGEDKPIRNPYYKTPAWKLWYADPTPVESPRLIAPGQVGKLAPTAEADRLYPDDGDTKAATKPTTTPALSLRKGDWPERKYAGIWDDVYLSMDNNGTNPPTPHSWMPNSIAWNAKLGYAIPRLDGKFMAIYGAYAIKEFGVNFTSQSTTGMGHDIANSGPRVGQIERDMYFANCLRCGPAANGAHGEADFFKVQDMYQALVPCFFNSCGQSNSEVRALAKMMIVGGYLPKEMKPELKRNGLYIATLLYIWKASLPYEAPYDSELRHRVAYVAAGDQLIPSYLINRQFHLYDDTAHMANMIAMAKSMIVAPPVSSVKKVELVGGTEQYFYKTAALIHQKAGETIKLRVSTADSFDLADKPLTFRWKVLYGNSKTTIEQEGKTDTYVITVPPDEKLPKGRTSILLVANNGTFDSNPACINIYRPDGQTNLRPTIETIPDRVIFPGEKVTFEIKAKDPEGFLVTFYRRSGEVGTLKGSTFTWDCPATTPESVYPVTILVSDGTGGYNSQQISITVASIRAKLTADKTVGLAPLAVRLSAKESGDRQKNPLAYKWDFGDGQTSTDAEPAHTFAEAGCYRVKLVATGPLGSHTDQLVVTAAHAWPIQLDKGWNEKAVDEAVWNVKDLPKGAATIRGGNLAISCPAKSETVLESAKAFAPPFYLEAEFKKAWATKGDGFNILGRYIGWDYTGGTSLMQIRNAAANQKQDIGQYLTDPTLEKATLRLYVVPDPAHPGKARFTGYLDCLLGPYFFSLDDQDVSPATLKAICTFASMELSRFQVWAAQLSIRVPSAISSAPAGK